MNLFLDIPDLVNIFKNPTLHVPTAGLVKSTIAIGSALGVIFIFINLGWGMVEEVFINGVKNVSFFDRKELTRGIIHFLLIFIMPAVILSISNVGTIVGGTLNVSSAEMGVKIKEVSEAVFKNVEKDDVDIFSPLSAIIWKWTVYFFLYLAFVLLFLIRFIMLVFTKLLLSFLVIVSPLAASFGMLKMFSGQLKALLALAFNISFITLTFNILDRMFFSGLISSIKNTPSLATTTNSLLITAAIFSMVVMYIMAIWLTSKYVGTPGASAIAQMGATVATIATMAAMKLMSKGAEAGAGAGAGSKSPGAGDVANTIKEDLKENPKE